MKMVPLIVGVFTEKGDWVLRSVSTREIAQRAPAESWLAAVVAVFLYDGKCTLFGKIAK